MFPERAKWQNWASLGHIFQEHQTIFFFRSKLLGTQQGGEVVSQLLMVVNTEALDRISV